MKIKKKGIKVLIVILVTFISLWGCNLHSKAASLYVSKLSLKVEVKDKGWTNKELKININGKDESRKIGIKHLILPNGERVYPESKNNNEISYNFMVEENGEYLFIIEGNDGNSLEETIMISNIDKTPPDLTFEKINIKGEVFVRIFVFDEGSGLRKIILPNGKEVSIDKKIEKKLAEGITYPIEKGGEYEYGHEYGVKLIDKLGNTTTKVIVIEDEDEDIDAVPPVITVLPYETGWTNKDVVVEAIVDKGKINKSSHTFEKNGSFIFTAEDKLGNKAKPVIVRVSNIDKIPPSEPRVTKDNINHRLVLASGIDNQSGIDKTIYSLDEEKWEDFTDYVSLIDLKDDNYKITIKTLDKAGNESISSFLFKIEYGAIMNDIQKIILNAKNVNDLNKVEELFIKLPNTKNKEELREKLNKKIIEIEKLINRCNTATELNRAENAISVAEKMKKDVYIKNAEAVISKLIDSPEKDAFLERLLALTGTSDKDKDNGNISEINNELSIMRAENAVSAAEKMKKEVYIKNAEKVVNKLIKSPEKTMFLNRIEALITNDGKREESDAREDKVNNTIDLTRAENAVSTAEKMKKEVYIKNAENVVNKLIDSPEKDAFLERLEALRD